MAASDIARKCLLFFLFVLIDPFGLASNTSTVSQQLVHRALSLYVSEIALGKIAVVLVDDRSASLINGERGYPLTFSQHADVLRPVLCAGPAALLIDITFRGIRSDTPPDQRGTLDPELAELMAVLDGARRSAGSFCQRLGFEAGTGPPAQIILARTRSSPPGPCDPLFDLPLEETCRLGRQLDRLKEVARPVSVAPIEQDGSYPLLADGVRSGTYEPGPSLAMVLALCERLAADERSTLPGCNDGDALAGLGGVAGAPVREDRRIAPVWPFYKTRAWLDDQQSTAGIAVGSGGPGTGCRIEQAGPEDGELGRLALLAAELWQILLSFEGPTGRVFGVGTCLPFDTFGAFDIYQIVSSCSADGDACRRRLATFFRGRMVFYGVDITGINDGVTSHVLGHVPGVAFHATIAENLLRAGSRHLSPLESTEVLGIRMPLLGAAIDTIAFALALILVTVVFAAAWSRFWIAGLATGVVMGLAIASIGLAAGAGLPALKVAVASAAWLTLFAILASQFVRPRRGSRWAANIARFAVALPVLMLISAAVMLLLHVPPSNIIATILFSVDLTEAPASAA